MEDDVREGSGVVTEAASTSDVPSPMQELRALNEVMAALHRLRDERAQARVIRAASSFLNLAPEPPSHSLPQPRPMTAHGYGPLVNTLYPEHSEERSISAKDFLLQKQPRTDVERVACLAYYLTHYRETPFFKTIDISKLNTEAAQPKFSNAAKSVDSATASRYLVPALKGNKQLSAAGEQYVKALPDRDAAKSAMNAAKPRKKRRNNNPVPGERAEVEEQ